ncbi:serine/threonine-protein kinase [Actinomadura fibrosa]|uniref:Serine/threonine-protein kinase n=1 Tax=Actinomadura fibrosa TaxID=111802 RepID=A0ABW2XG25_9ACTN|nr:serine/threonine-protein kinase [Actinomadura fibrosa]
MLDGQLPQSALPGYELLDELGRGGMGVVYRARAVGDGASAEPLAIKVIRPELAGDPAYRSRFAQEIDRARRVTHENIVPVLDAGEHEGHLYLVMPCVDGTTLKDILDKLDRMTPAKAVETIVRIADALDSVHEAGLLHGDVSPCNIILAGSRSSPRPMLTDFGLARPLSTAGLSAAETWARTGAGIGTPGFMAPEAVSGDRLTPAADVYSLAAVLHYVLIGKAPLGGMTPLRKQRPEIPRRVEQAVVRALSADPADRHASARQFADALLDARPNRSRWLRIAPAAAVTALLITLAFTYMYGRPAHGRVAGQAAPSPSPTPTAPSPSATRTPKPSHTATAAPPLSSPTSARPSRTSSPRPSQGTRVPVRCDRYKVTAHDMYLRTENNELTNDSLVRGEIATVTRRGAPGGRTQLWYVTTDRGQRGWVYEDDRYWTPYC